MRKEEYSEYLESEEWAQKKKEILRRAGYRCRRCGAKGVKLHIHHETYVRLGNERMSDLTALCSKCHAEVHGREEEAKVGCANSIIVMIFIFVVAVVILNLVNSRF